MHIQSHTHTQKITSVGEDYEYYWNKNTFFSDDDSHFVLGAVLDLALPIVFHVQEAFRKLYVQKTGIRDSHGAVTLPLEKRFPQYSTHINLETYTSSVVPACSTIHRLWLHCTPRCCGAMTQNRSCSVNF